MKKRKKRTAVPAAQSPFDTTLKNLKIMKHSILTVSPDRVRQNNINYKLAKILSPYLSTEGKVK